MQCDSPSFIVGIQIQDELLPSNRTAHLDLQTLRSVATRSTFITLQNIQHVCNWDNLHIVSDNSADFTDVRAIDESSG